MAAEEGSGGDDLTQGFLSMLEQKIEESGSDDVRWKEVVQCDVTSTQTAVYNGTCTYVTY